MLEAWLSEIVLSILWVYCISSDVISGVIRPNKADGEMCLPIRDFKQLKKIELLLDEDTEEILIGNFRLKIRHDAKNPIIRL